MCSEHHVGPRGLLNHELLGDKKVFLCEEWERGTKNVDQLRATYFILTGKRLIIRSGGPRTGVNFIEGDLKQLAQEVDAACEVLSIGSG